MRLFLAAFLLFNASLFVSEPVYAQDFNISQKLEKIYDGILSNETVAKCVSSVKFGWESFKVWFSKLPGIKQYNESVYSDKNWKKEMDSMASEYSPHLQGDSGGIKRLREGKKEWDKL